MPSPGGACRAIRPPTTSRSADERLRPMLAALSRDLAMVADPVEADVVHAHTWYTHFAGLLARLSYGIPLVVTVHSLEPLRPWKREQLGGGYDVSSWIERMALETADAVVAVSHETRVDVLRLFDVPADRVHVIHNGIDADFYHPDPDPTRARASRGRSDGAVRSLRRPHHPSEGDRSPRSRDPPPGPGHRRRALRRTARYAGDRGRDGARGRRRAGGATERGLDRRDGQPRGGSPALLACGRVLLPIGLRAVRDHQPGGRRMRDPRRRLGGRRHPGGGGRR